MSVKWLWWAGAMSAVLLGARSLVVGEPTVVGHFALLLLVCIVGVKVALLEDRLRR